MIWNEHIYNMMEPLAKPQVTKSTFIRFDVVILIFIFRLINFDANK